MHEQASIVLAVASYSTRRDAEHDFDSARLVRQEGKLDQLAAAVLEKDADGRLVIRRHDSTAEHLAAPGALLGAAMSVIAPPLGIAFLAAVLPTRAGWAAVGVIADHFWHHIPKDTLRRLSDLLESGQAALLIVAVNHKGGDVASLLTHPTDEIVNQSILADLEEDLSATGGAAQPPPEPRAVERNGRLTRR